MRKIIHLRVSCVIRGMRLWLFKQLTNIRSQRILKKINIVFEVYVLLVVDTHGASQSYYL